MRHHRKDFVLESQRVKMLDRLRSTPGKFHDGTLLRLVPSFRLSKILRGVCIGRADEPTGKNLDALTCSLPPIARPRGECDGPIYGGLP